MTPPDSSAPRRVLVVGATGNVGTALLRRLARERVEVSGVARRVPRPQDSAAAGARWHGIDISAPHAVSSLREAMAGVDAVVHLAWALQPSHDEQRQLAVNVEGTRHVAQAAVEAGVPHLVLSSSLGVYAAGPKEPVGEDWPATGIPTSPYSRHKVAAEAVVDEVEASSSLLVTRVRPGLVLQREAGAEISRLFAGPFVPRAAFGGLRLPVLPLPVLPLPAGLVIQAVHADDLAAAFWAVLTHRPGGAVNVAADPPLGPDEIARAFGAKRSVAIPASALRTLAEVSWKAHVQPTDPGWVDLGMEVPLMSTERARTELGWAPTISATAALADLFAGLRAGAGTSSPPLSARGLLRGRWTPAS